MQSKKKLTTAFFRNFKNSSSPPRAPLQVLTCYDFSNATLLNTLPLHMILVGDSAGNVIFGHETTVNVTLEEMIMLGSSVRRGAADTFVVVDMPFGSYATVEDGLKNSIKLFQQTKADAIKVEGATPTTLMLIDRLIEVGIPVMGHLGLTPQSIHQIGSYRKHGKDEQEAEKLYFDALNLEKAGCFSLVLECTTENLSERITQKLTIPTIGIGAGKKVVDGQVLVLNDLLQDGNHRIPSFCKPIANLFEIKRELLLNYLSES